ncbi:MAG: B12-binding domain-containing radical SAM protein [Nanoarchaeota archaeon]|nr:B12-binding domain-containing radical SAM protein [Nanoarchaeota archaeon]
MKVLLITPPYDFIKEGFGSKSNIKVGQLPNLGLCYIGAILEKNGHSVKILDAQASNLSCEETAKEVKRLDYDLIGISVTNAHYKEIKNLIPLIRKNFNGKIVLGGPHVSCFPEKILEENPGIDISVIGEGEITIVEIIEAIENKKSLSNIKGIAYKEDKKIILTEKRPTLMKLDDLPNPAWHLLNFNLYCPLPDQYKKKPAISMITSRGCTWKKCAFCFEAGVNSKVYRRHSPERIIENIILLQNQYGIKEIDFLDDEFLINESWIERFSNLIKENNIKLSWSAFGRVDHVTDRMLKLAKESGCWGVYFGFETGDEELLKVVNKGTTLEQAKKACEWCHKHRIEIRGSFMLGLPGETPEKAMKTINFAIELGLNTAAFRLTYPEYGTKLYETAIKEGKLIEGWQKMTEVSYIPNGYKNADELKNIQKLAFRKFYFRPTYILNRIISIRSFNDLKRNYDGLKFLLGIF